jgi:antitoxin CptB
MSETPEARLKRMKMRSWRRGTKEMDMILGPYADSHLAAMEPETLDLFDRLLWENDQDLLPWILGQVVSPPEYAQLMPEIARFSRNRLTI